jgi:hypothetical protein
MFPHPIMVHTVSELRRQERLTAVECERQATMAAGPASHRQSLAVRARALVTRHRVRCGLSCRRSSRATPAATPAA